VGVGAATAAAAAAAAALGRGHRRRGGQHSSRRRGYHGSEFQVIVVKLAVAVEVEEVDYVVLRREACKRVMGFLVRRGDYRVGWVGVRFDAVGNQRGLFGGVKGASTQRSESVVLHSHSTMERGMPEVPLIAKPLQTNDGVNEATPATEAMR